MIRAAAKNFPDVIVLVDTSDYGWVGERLAQGTSTNTVTVGERRSLARKAFQHVALYDTAISQYLDKPATVDSEEKTYGFTKLYGMRYGENPHQQAALYADVLSTGGIVRAEQLHGQELSFNNVLDADAAWTTVDDFDEQAVTVVKHTNPCGLAVGDVQRAAYQRAFEGDPMSAYGGILGFNRTLTVATAKAMKGVLYHVVVAPGYEPEALAILRKRKQLRILRATPAAGPLANVNIRKVSGGALVQTSDNIVEDPSTWKVVTKRSPTEAELRNLAFAWKAGRHIRSNTIVLAKDGAMVGMGTGQPNRVTSIHLAIRTAGDEARGSALASDAYMPFADNIDMAFEGGITAIVQPGGSIRDDEVTEAADKLGMAMVFTGVRHFKH